jgi:hypothetical protein
VYSVPPGTAMCQVQLAICWNVRESGTTRLQVWAVTMRPVRIISRKPKLGILRDCTPTASREVKIQSVLNGDIERSAEMTDPLALRSSQNQIVP